MWMCADAPNGFVCNMQVYTGKKDDGATEHGLGYRVVRDLTRPFINKNHHVFADNFFTIPFHWLAICYETTLISVEPFVSISTASRPV